MARYTDLNTFFTNSDERTSPALTDIDDIKQAKFHLIVIMVQH